MFIVFHSAGAEIDLEVVVHDPEATVADLAKALVGATESSAEVVADGQPIAGHRRLDRAGIYDGSMVELGDAPAPRLAATTPPGPVRLLSIVGGLDSGATVPLGRGRSTIGRSRNSVMVTNPTVSGRHASIDLKADGSVFVADEGSRNGTWIANRPIINPIEVDLGAIVRLGAAQLTMGTSTDDRPARSAAGGRGSTIAFNRPPRPVRSVAPELLDPPDPPAPGEGNSPVGIVAVVAPVLMGLVMIKVFGSLLFGLFALLGPIMLIGSALESKRRRKRGSRRERQRFTQELHKFQGELHQRAGEARARLLEDAPDPAEVLRRATQPSVRLWERRPQHRDFLQVRAGIATVPWTPPVQGEARSFHPEVVQEIEQSARLDDAPLVVDLTNGSVLGLVGDRDAALAVARSLIVQAATHQGPADLPIMVLAAAECSADWDWVKWLPHTSDPTRSGARRLSRSPEYSDTLLRDLLEQHAAENGSGSDDAESKCRPITLVMIDDESLTAGRRSPARSVLRGKAGPVAGIVMAETEDRLPAVCDQVLELCDADGTARFHRLVVGFEVGLVLATGVSAETARRAARSLARFEDPELVIPGGSLPAKVTLLPLLGPEPLDEQGLVRRWAGSHRDAGLVAPIGVGEDGVLAVDLVRDGPHALVAGTTGAGKSELLRTLVVGLATTYSPDDLTFVLIDFKGGSAFDCCANLPHVVGMVTDLDPHLAERALRCMEAELRYRERRLREAGMADIAAFSRARSASLEPLPRLVVVIDEFATLKTEIPDFVESLVGVAQRGRSLGVHLVLATQRPSGAVSDNIRANTNLRIALRVQDARDSCDVIDIPDAATIGRNQPGRALARLGPGEVMTLQTALATGSTGAAVGAGVAVRPFGFGSDREGADEDNTLAEETSAREATADDLTRLVEVAGTAHLLSGRQPPRRPWPDPLPPEVDLDQVIKLDPVEGPPDRFGSPGVIIAFALADDPDAQEQYPTGWDPSAGNLLLFGIPGSGTTTACRSLALAVAARYSPDDVHIHLLDYGTGELGELAELPHVGSVVTVLERERQARLVGWLRTELDRRRALREPCASEPRALLILDGMAGFRAEWEESLLGVMVDLLQVFADGPEVGLHMVVAADRTASVPSSTAALARQRWLFRMADPNEYGAIGLPSRAIPDLQVGGAIMVDSLREVQVARPDTGTTPMVAACRRRWAAATMRTPRRIEVLPGHITADRVSTAARVDESPLFVPIGLCHTDLAPAGFTLYPGENALIAGPARSGRSTALATMAQVIRSRPSPPRVVAVASRRSPLRRSAAVHGWFDPTDLHSMSVDLAATSDPVVLLVDDAELVDDPGGAITALLAERRDGLHVIAAGRNESLRGLYVHWTRTVRQSRSALLLQPDIDLDGDLVGVTLPRRSIVPIGPGRGYLLDEGRVDLVQVAEPECGLD